MTLANVQCLDCFTCISFRRKAVCNKLQELDFKIKTLSQIHYSYAYVCIKINCVKASLRYVYMSFSQALFRQQLSSNLDSCLFLSNHKALQWKSYSKPTQRANQWILTFYHNRFFHIINIIFWLTLFSQHKNFHGTHFYVQICWATCQTFAVVIA